MKTLRSSLAAILLASMATAAPAADLPDPLELHGHTKAVSVVAWAADGKSLATAADDRTIRLWDPESGQQTGSLQEIAREGYGGPVVAFTADLGMAAVNYWGEVTIRRLVDGEVLTRISPVPDVPGRRSAFRPDVVAMAFSPDGTRLATAGSLGVVGGPHGLPGGIVMIWDAGTGKVVHQSEPLSTAASSLAWSPDGKRYAAGTNGAGGELPEPGEIRIWDAETGQMRYSFKAQPDVAPGEWASAGDVAFSPDGSRIAAPTTAGSRAAPVGLLINDTGASIRVWDLRTGEVSQRLPRHSASVHRIAFRPDGKGLATASSDKVVRIWDLETEKDLATVKSPERITAFAFSPDGKSLAVGGDGGSVRIWTMPE